ncbi:MAG: L-glutamate gamma-semialdehyde dehydrogenase [Thermodesulfobacteriota bacterium]
MDAVFTMPEPKNEPTLSYAPGTPEREKLKLAVDRVYNEKIEIPLIIGGKEVKTGDTADAVMPTEHSHVLATFHRAGEKEINDAVKAAADAKNEWENMEWADRAAIMLKAAELITDKYRYEINAATMLGQGKNAHQAEIEAVMELADFLRFNVKYMEEIYRNQPRSVKGVYNRMEYRPLEGFVLAITPFNFTAIGGNLPTAPAMMGNTVIWKPATAAVLSNYYVMRILLEAGLPDGVINFLPAKGSQIGEALFSNPDLAGIHFTGSTGVFQKMWKSVGENIQTYKSYPRIVGETGGKDYMVVHKSAACWMEEMKTAIVRAAYEYQGQKCSALSRAYIPESVWADMEPGLLGLVKGIKTGCVRGFTNFVNAVIDESAFDNIMSYIDHAEKSDEAEILAGGKGDKTNGFFIEPTIIKTNNPYFKTMQEEIFGPVLTVYVYPDDEYEKCLELCDKTSPYGLTGALWSRDRIALNKGMKMLRHTAGNFYINDKPTASIVSQQPFGGARGSGTNDKAGSFMNLMRWTSARAIKENFVPPEDYRYPFMDAE